MIIYFVEGLGFNHTVHLTHNRSGVSLKPSRRMLQISLESAMYSTRGRYDSSAVGRARGWLLWRMRSFYLEWLPRSSNGDESLRP